MRVVAEVEGQADTRKEVNVTFSQPSSWPFQGVPEPVKPTGLTVDTSGIYKTGQDGREYRGGTFDDKVPDKRIVFNGAHFTWFEVRAPGEDIWFVNCDIGPRGQGIHPVVSSGFQAPVAKRVVFDGCQFHGMHQGTVQDHTEGLQIGGVDVLWIKNCRFYDNHVFDMLISSWTPAPIRNVLIENCTFDVTRDANGKEGFYSILISGNSPGSNGIIRNCRVAQPITVDPAVEAMWRLENLTHI